MSKKNIIILVIAIVLVILAIIFCVWVNNSNNDVVEENVVVEEISKTKDLENVDYEDFTFYREDKSEVKFSDYKDKATVILFWNSNNEDSIEDLKKVNSMYEKYKDKINFLMISTAEEVDEKIKSEVSMELFYDFYKEGQIKYKINEVPTLIYLTENNEIFNAKVGFTTSDALEANLDLITNNI